MTSATKLILLGLAFVSMVLAETVTDFTDCPATQLSVGASGVKTYECKTEEDKWIKPVFTVANPAAAVTAATKSTFYNSANPYEYTFPLGTKMTFSAVTTCPEMVTTSMECDELKLFFGKSYDSADGSPVKIGSAGGAGLSQFKCTDNAITMYYHFFITISADTTATASGDIADSFDAIAVIRADTSGEVLTASANMKPAAFQKFGEVNEDTMTYYVKTSDAAYKIFKSDATTVTLTRGDYDEAFGTDITSDPTAFQPCGDAVQLLFKEQSGSSNIYATTMLMFAPFILSLFK